MKMESSSSLKILLAACLLVALLASGSVEANESGAPEGRAEQIEQRWPFDLGEAVKSRFRRLAHKLVANSLPGCSNEERRQRLGTLAQSEELETAQADGPSGEESAGGQLAKSNKPEHERVKLVSDTEASWLLSGW